MALDVNTDAVVVIRVRRHVENSEVWIAPELTEYHRDQLDHTLTSALTWLAGHWQQQVVDA